MDVITSKMFYQVKEEIRKDIIEWWNPKPLDLIETNEGEISLICQDIELSWSNIRKKRDGYELEDVVACKNDVVERHKKYSFVPLLTVQQLISFIEWKTELSCEYCHSIASNEIYIEVWNNMTCEKSKYIIKRKDGNLLLGLWECVSKIYEQ